MDRFLRLINIKDKNKVEGGANLFPEHLYDPQNNLFLRGGRVAEILIGISLPDPLT